VVWSSSGLVCVEDLQPSGSQQTRRGNTSPPRFCHDLSCKSKCDLLMNFVLHVGAVSYLYVITNCVWYGLEQFACTSGDEVEKWISAFQNAKEQVT
jgi:hypothetical protein